MRIWKGPAWVAVATVMGLSGALLLDGAAAKSAACLALATPILTVAWSFCNRRRFYSHA